MRHPHGGLALLLQQPRSSAPTGRLPIYEGCFCSAAGEVARRAGRYD